MTNQIEDTAKIIDMMSARMVYASDKLNEHAENLRKGEDFSHAGSAMNTVINCLVNMRLDKLVTKTLKDDWFDNFKT